MSAAANPGTGGAAAAVAVDHLVVAAATLEQGVAWAQLLFGHAPEAGGRHAFMGTHNRIFSIASASFPRAYLEIIAIDPAGAKPAHPRWFGLDEPALQRALAPGPRLIHWVARCADVNATVAAFRAAGFDPGDAVAAERATPQGLLRWQITVRPDGRRLCDGALPTLIEWGAVHPSSTLPESGCALETLSLPGLPTSIGALLRESGADLALNGGARLTGGPWTVAMAPANPSPDAPVAPLVAVIRTPRGPVTLRSVGPANGRGG